MSKKRTKIHTHTKKDIDKLFKNGIYNECKVLLIKFTAEDIANYKSSLIKNKDRTHNEAMNASTTDNEPAKKKQKLNTNGKNVLKLELSREGKTKIFKSQFKSSIKNDKEIASTSNSSAKNVKPTIWIIDPKIIIDEDKYKSYIKSFFHNDNSKQLTNGMKKLAVVKPSTIVSTPSLHSTKVNGAGNNLAEIEKLYKKYFSKSAQDTIVIIANILNIILISNKYIQSKVTKHLKKSSEVAKLKEKYDANLLHGKYQKVLEIKLKNNFINVISSFAEPEFDSALQMFFISLLSVIRAMDQPQFRKIDIKYLVLLLWDSLKNSDYNHSKIVSIFRSKKFQSDCIVLTRLIVESRNNDPGVTDRMSMFFLSRVNNQQYFQTVIDTVTSDSIKDLALLIDDAIFQCCINSEFKDPVGLSTEKHLNYKLPVTETIQSSINSGEEVQYLYLAKNLDGTYQQTSVLNGNTTLEPSIVMSQRLNNYYESFCSSLQEKTSEVIPTKKLSGVSSTICNSPMLRITNSWTLTKTSVISTDLLVEIPPIVLTKCYAENCNNSAIMMCSICTTAKYCSDECFKCDWYDNHINDCERLLNIRQT